MKLKRDIMLLFQIDYEKIFKFNILGQRRYYEECLCNNNKF